MRQHVGELSLHLHSCQASSERGQQVDAVGQRVEPVGRTACPAEPFDAWLQPVDEFGEPPGQLDPVAADVVERKRGAQPRL